MFDQNATFQCFNFKLLSAGFNTEKCLNLDSSGSRCLVLQNAPCFKMVNAAFQYWKMLDFSGEIARFQNWKMLDFSFQ